MLLFIGFKSLFFGFLAKKTGFCFSEEVIKKLVGKKVVKFIPDLLLL